MGKGRGGGRGGGRGKGGCECFEAMHAFACCLCLVLVGGPILIAIGASILASATRNDRGRSIESVNAAVVVWNDPLNQNGWQNFQKLKIYATSRPGFGTESNCPTETVALRVDSSSYDSYSDESSRFQPVRQLRFQFEMPYTRFVTCRMQVTLQQVLPDQTANQTLAILPAIGDDTLSYSILVDKAVGPRSCPSRTDTCYGSAARNCLYNCESYFGGNFDCTNGNFYCNIKNAYYNNLAVKVAYKAASISGTVPSYGLDGTVPGAGSGANVMPAGFVRQYTPLTSSGVSAGPLFQLPNIRPPRGAWAGLPGMPVTMSVTVRSSADPWLTYMAVTGGSGYLGVRKRTLVASGVILVIIGCLGTICWCFAAFTAWRMMCARNRPTSRPEGVQGYAWDLANRYGGQYAPAIGVPVHGTGHDGMPTAQPLYGHQGGQYGSPYGGNPGEPATGQPAPGYPYPYGGQQQQFQPYPSYPGAQPPPGSHIEMSHYQYGGSTAAPQQQSYGSPYGAGMTAAQQQQQEAYQAYPQQQQQQSPQQGGQAGAGGPPPAGATAAYAYPGGYAPAPYPYPPYGQQPDGAAAAAGAAGPAPPPPAGEGLRTPLTGYSSGGPGPGPSDGAGGSAAPPAGYPKM